MSMNNSTESSTIKFNIHANILGEVFVPLSNNTKLPEVHVSGQILQDYQDFALQVLASAESFGFSLEGASCIDSDMNIVSFKTSSESLSKSLDMKISICQHTIYNVNKVSDDEVGWKLENVYVNGEKIEDYRSALDYIQSEFRRQLNT